MLKEEFVSGYCERSNISKEFFNEYMVAMECDCGDEDCPKFAAISKNHISIQSHKELHMSKEQLDHLVFDEKAEY